MVRAITHLTWLRFNRRSLEMRLLWYPGEFLTISAKKTFATWGNSGIVPHEGTRKIDRMLEELRTPTAIGYSARRGQSSKK